MHESEKWKWSRSVVSDSLWPHGLQPSRLLCPWDFPGKSTGVGCHCLLCIIRMVLQYFTHVFLKLKRRLISFWFYVCCHKFNSSLSYYILFFFFYCVFFIIMENRVTIFCWNFLHGRLFSGFNACYSLFYLKKKNRILESIHFSNLCECFYLPDVLGSINLPERFVKCVVIPEAPGLSKFSPKEITRFDRKII